MIFGHKRTVFSIIAEYRIVNYRILTLKRPFLNRSYRNIFLLEIFFSDSIGISLKWKSDAAKTASALPTVKAS